MSNYPGPDDDDGDDDVDDDGDRDTEGPGQEAESGGFWDWLTGGDKSDNEPWGEH